MYIRKNYLNSLNLFFFLVIIFISCQEKAVEQQAENTPQTDTIVREPDAYLPVNQDENKDRDVWQKPKIVIDMLGDLSDKTVADIGAGTGYFTFRFALEAKKVIAIDIENQFLEIINIFKRNLPVDVQERIETRLAKPNDPLLNPEEADLVVIINTIGFINNRQQYFRTLLPGMKKGSQLVIVDYKIKNLPLEIAPPVDDRVPLNVIEQELEAAGFVNIISNDTSLDYQYVVFASKGL